MQGLDGQMTARDEENLLICMSAWSCHHSTEVRVRSVEHILSMCRLLRPSR